jgi:hypothetical protein
VGRKIEVLGLEDFRAKGMFFVCTCDDIQLTDKADIAEWFSGVKKITLNNENEFEIIAVAPMISFIGKVTVLIKINASKIPTGIYPTMATVE